MRSAIGSRFVVTFAALTAWGCSNDVAPLDDETAFGDGEQAIVNGQLDSGDPATVYISLGGGSCTGTLISPTIVLTAKHCTDGVATSNISVLFGNSANGPGTWIKAVHYENNPGGQNGGPGDLALITLKQVGPTAPIPVYENNLANHVGAPIRIVGFGVTGEYASDSGKKRQGMTKILSVQKGLIFTGGPSSPSKTCYGDSGGPNFIKVDGVEYVAAATSFGTAACGQGEDGAARVDDAMPWIKKYIAAHEMVAPKCEADGQCAKGCPQPDPDCPCAGDGFCTNACSNLATDPDCAGCEPNGTCRTDCPKLDTDCCTANGDCFSQCGALDPDCNGDVTSTSASTGGGVGAGGSSGSGSGSGAGPSSGSGGSKPNEPTKTRKGGAYTLGACAAAPARSPSTATWALFLGAGLALAGRQRQRMSIRSAPRGQFALARSSATRCCKRFR